MTVNRGFTFEDEDRSVGIFGSAWFHDPCPEYEPDWLAEMTVIEQQIAGVRRDDWTVRFWYLLTCADCAQQTLVYDDQMSPSDEAIAAQERAEYEAAKSERYDQAQADLADAKMAHWDNDPNPYHGTYSEC